MNGAATVRERSVPLRVRSCHQPQARPRGSKPPGFRRSGHTAMVVTQIRPVLSRTPAIRVELSRSEGLYTRVVAFHSQLSPGIGPASNHREATGSCVPRARGPRRWAAWTAWLGTQLVGVLDSAAALAQFPGVLVSQAPQSSLNERCGADDVDRAIRLLHASGPMETGTGSTEGSAEILRLPS